MSKKVTIKIWMIFFLFSSLFFSTVVEIVAAQKVKDVGGGTGGESKCTVTTGTFFTDNRDGTVTANSSKLVWQK